MKHLKTILALTSCSPLLLAPASILSLTQQTNWSPSQVLELSLTSNKISFTSNKSKNWHSNTWFAQFSTNDIYSLGCNCLFGKNSCSFGIASTPVAFDLNLSLTQAVFNKLTAGQTLPLSQLNPTLANKSEILGNFHLANKASYGNQLLYPSSYLASWNSLQPDGLNIIPNTSPANYIYNGAKFVCQAFDEESQSLSDPSIYSFTNNYGIGSSNQLNSYYQILHHPCFGNYLTSKEITTIQNLFQKEVLDNYDFVVNKWFSISDTSADDALIKVGFFVSLHLDAFEAKFKNDVLTINQIKDPWSFYLLIQSPGANSVDEKNIPFYDCVRWTGSSTGATNFHNAGSFHEQLYTIGYNGGLDQTASQGLSWSQDIGKNPLDEK